MAELVPVSPLTLDLLASLAATDQLLAITDPAGAPGLGRVPLSGLDDRFALKDATNITAATWRAAVGVPSGVIHAADSTARLALTGYFNGQLVIQDDTLVTYSLINDADPSNAASWDDLSIGSVAWADITGVPATFAPAAHTQTASTITDFATAVGLIAQPVVGGATLNDVATFDASGFVQDSGVLISNVIVEGDARLTDARAPTAHTHPFSEVTGDIDIAQFPVGAANQFLRINLAGTAIEWVSVPGGGDLLSTNNLSDLADAATARVNLDLEIGVDVQAYDAMLDELSALVSPGADRILFWDNSTANLDWLVPSANLAITTTNLDVASTVMLKADNLSGLANTGTSRTNLGVAIGTDVQAHDVLLDSFAALADPGADRVLFWDESAGVGGAMAWLTMGTGLTITATTLDASGGVPGAHAASHVNGTDDIQDATAAQKGLMTAAYGTKLDGIEAGATADQSAAEILAALLTVDGAGSGLDADLLDGNSSAAFATAAQGALADTAIQPQLAENNPVLFDAALSADGQYSGFCIAGTAGATLAFGDLCYLAVADSRWELADADAEATAGGVMLGICVLAAAADASATRMLLIGNIRADAAFPALTIGAPAYVGTTAGDIQVAQPNGEDDVIRICGWATTADELFFNPSRDWMTYTV